MNRIQYTVTIKEPYTQIITVEAVFPAGDTDIFEFSLPAWSPGVYEIADYCKNVLSIGATSEGGENLPIEQIAKGSWKVHRDQGKTIHITYNYLAAELHDSTCYVDRERCHISGTALFVFAENLRHLPVTLKVIPPSDWEVVTAMDPVKNEQNTFSAQDFDALADSVIELGHFEILEFSYRRKEYKIVISGKGNHDADKLKSDVTKLVKTAVTFFKGKAPFNRYYFILFLIEKGMEGLEHKNSTVLLWPALSFTEKQQYADFLSLVSHEFFHAWNVKTIKPSDFNHYSYLTEDYTKMLWFAEGLTNYYGDLLMQRSGIWTRDEYFQHLTLRLKQILEIPGRKLSSLEKASYDSWYRHGQPNPNTLNISVSYYKKGELVGLMLDLFIRHLSENNHSLDDVMRELYTAARKTNRGINTEQLKQIIENYTTHDFSDFFGNFIAGTVELPLNEYLNYAGLRLVEKSPTPEITQVQTKSVDSTKTDETSWSGIRTRTQNNNLYAGFVHRDSAAHRAGIHSGDEIIAVESFRVDEKKMNAILDSKKPGDTLEIIIARHGTIVPIILTLDEKEKTEYSIKPVKKPDSLQMKILDDWLVKEK